MKIRIKESSRTGGDHYHLNRQYFGVRIPLSRAIPETLPAEGSRIKWEADSRNCLILPPIHHFRQNEVAARDLLTRYHVLPNFIRAPLAKVLSEANILIELPGSITGSDISNVTKPPPHRAFRGHAKFFAAELYSELDKLLTKDLFSDAKTAIPLLVERLNLRSSAIKGDARLYFETAEDTRIRKESLRFVAEMLERYAKALLSTRPTD